MELEEKFSEEEEREVKEIERALPILLRKGFLNEIGCRIIISSSELWEKQGAIYGIMMSKSKEDAAYLTNIFRTLTRDVYSKVDLKLQHPDLKHLNTNQPLIANKNPFLKNTVIKTLFDYLPLNDIKNCRLVCNQWNSTAEILLRKRAKIHFRGDVILPKIFLRFSKYSHPELPFSAFKFSRDDDGEGCCVSEFDEFFKHYGKNIRELRFNRITFTREKYPDQTFQFYDVSPWLANASNITNLVIQMDSVVRPLLDISWEVLASLTALKTIALSKCVIVIEPGKNINRIRCESITLVFVAFGTDGKLLPNCCYNDVFDFSHSVKIHLRHYPITKRKVILDMENVEFTADKMILQNITVENWGKARGCVKDLELKICHLLEKTQLQIERLDSLRSTLDLSALPQNIDRLCLTDNNDIICSGSLDMPNLKWLSLELCDNNLSLLSNFQYCENLEMLRLTRSLTSDQPILFNVRYIPRNIKSLRLTCVELEFVDDYIREFSTGTLILESFKTKTSHFTDYKKITDKIRAKTVIVACYKHMAVDSKDIIELVLANKQAKRILVGTHSENYNLHKKNSFEGSNFSTYVDRKSNYYKFIDQVGKAIARSQFIRWY